MKKNHPAYGKLFLYTLFVAAGMMLACADKKVQSEDPATPADPNTPAGDSNVLPQQPGQAPRFSVTGIQPDKGNSEGGTPVRISGTLFASNPVPRILFDQAECTSVVTVSPTEITCNTPAHAPGMVAITLEQDNTKATYPNLFSYYALPAVKIGFVQSFGGGTSRGGGLTLSGGMGLIKPSSQSSGTGGFTHKPGQGGVLK